MANEPLRRRPETEDKPRPKIWAEGDQRPPFDLRAFGRASLAFARDGVAPLHAWAARTTRRVAVNVANGAGRIPEAKLGRAARFVPSHLRVAAWIKTLAAVLSHASATADRSVKRGNALVAEIEPHLWPDTALTVLPPETDPAPAPAPLMDGTAAVVLQEPLPPEDDPLRSIRDEMAGAGSSAPSFPAQTVSRPPAAPGPAALMAIQMSGYGLGWASSLVALPYGLARAMWLHMKGVDLRQIGTED